MSTRTVARTAAKERQCACGGIIKVGDRYLLHTEFPGGGSGYADFAGHPVEVPECEMCAIRHGRGHLVQGFYDDGTSGHAGGASSRERAEREDSTGVTGKRSQEILQILRERRTRGATSHEIETALGLGHGAVSGALTRLQRIGAAKRATRRRGRQEIYFAAEHFPDHYKEAPYRSTKYSAKKVAAEALREAALALYTAPNEDDVDFPPMGQRSLYGRWLDSRAAKLEAEMGINASE